MRGGKGKMSIMAEVEIAMLLLNSQQATPSKSELRYFLVSYIQTILSMN